MPKLRLRGLDHINSPVLIENENNVRGLNSLRGKGGVPWVQIMENELECLGDRRGHDGHLAKKFLKKDYS